jgi:hypothetical protein
MWHGKQVSAQYLEYHIKSPFWCSHTIVKFFRPKLHKGCKYVSEPVIWVDIIPFTYSEAYHYNQKLVKHKDKYLQVVVQRRMLEPQVEPEVGPWDEIAA